MRRSALLLLVLAACSSGAAVPPDATTCEAAKDGTPCTFGEGWAGSCFSEGCCWTCGRDAFEGAPCPFVYADGSMAMGKCDAAGACSLGVVAQIYRCGK